MTIFKTNSKITRTTNNKQPRMTNSDTINLGLTCDMHVHLRDNEMCELVTPTVREGGVSVAYIMPNLQPPITTAEQVKEYKDKLQKLSPETTFLMSFYLSQSLDPEVVGQAAKEELIQGIKCYPAGVTTNSADSNVDPNDFSQFYPLFEVMQREGLVLNLHGEKPSCDNDNDHIDVLNAESKFLPALQKLHRDFPTLRIILEHATTKDAIDTINEINKDVKNVEDVVVAASITAHHLWLTVDDWAGNPLNFCKPVAKTTRDRHALVEAATSGKPWFFFGSDSAPHPVENKARYLGVSAGIFTQKHAMAYLAQVFDKVGQLDKLPSFVSNFPLTFYQMNERRKSMIVSPNDNVVLFKHKHIVEEKTVSNSGNITVVPFQPGFELDWDVKFV